MNEGMIRLGGVWKEVATSGDIYYSGTINGNLKLLIFRNKQKGISGKGPDFEVFIKQLPPKQQEVTEPVEGEEM